MNPTQSLMITEAKGLIFVWNGPEAESQFLNGQDRTLWSLRRGGKKIALVTTASSVIFRHFLEQAEVQPMRFDTIFAAEEVGPYIADGQPMTMAAVDAFLRLNLLQNQIVLVGDTPANMQEAASAKIGFIAVASDAQREKLLQAGAAPGQIIPDLKDLPDFLGIIRNSVAM